MIDALENARFGGAFRNRAGLSKAADSRILIGLNPGPHLYGMLGPGGLKTRRKPL